MTAKHDALQQAKSLKGRIINASKNVESTRSKPTYKALGEINSGFPAKTIPGKLRREFRHDDIKK